MVQSTFVRYEYKKNGMKKLKEAILFCEGLIWDNFTFFKNS